jgi:hypothetical protein
MKTLASLLQVPTKTAPDKALLAYLLRLRTASSELAEATKAVEEELGRRRAVQLREKLKRG